MHWSGIRLVATALAAVGLTEVVNLIRYKNYRKRVLTQAQSRAQAEGLQLCIVQPSPKTSADVKSENIIYYNDEDIDRIITHLRLNPSVLVIDGAFETMEDIRFAILASILGEFDQDRLYCAHRPPWCLSAYLGGTKRIVVCEPPASSYVLVKRNPIVAWPWWSLVLVGVMSANFICSL